MNLDNGFAILDNPEGRHEEALRAISNHCTHSILQGLISRLVLHHLQPLKIVLHQCLLHMVQGDMWLQECLIEAFIEAEDGLQKALMPVMAQLGAKSLMLEKLSQACMNETNAKRGDRFFKLMAGFPKEWNGAEGHKIRTLLKKSQFVHRALFCIDHLKDKQWRVRQATADALGETKNAKAVDALIPALKDSDSDVIMSVARALGKIRDRRAVEPLIRTLKDRSILDRPSSVRRSVAESLSQMGARAVASLILTLSDSDDDICDYAVTALVAIGEQSVEPLILALKNSNNNVRKNAAQALGKMGDTRAVEPLISALQDSDENVRINSTEALGQLGDTPVVEFLSQTLLDENSDVRKQAAKALGQIGGSKAVKRLIRALQDSDLAVQLCAVEALVEIGSLSVASLIRALQVYHSEIRKNLVLALGEIKDTRAIEPLIRVLNDRDSELRKQVVLALGKLKDVRAIEALTSSLMDVDENVRKQSAKTLNQIGDTYVVERLSQNLLDEKSAVRRHLTKAYGQTRKPAIDPLIWALQDKDQEVSCFAARILAQIGDDKVVKHLIITLKYADLEICRYAIEALGEIGGSVAIDALIMRLRDPDWKVQFYASNALEKIGRAAVKALVLALKNSEGHVCKSIA